MRRLALLVTLALVACAPPPAPVESLPDPPERWSAPAIERAVEPAWWSGFGDERLEQLIALALERNLDLQAAAARVEQAAALARIAGAAREPSVAARIDGQRAQNRPIGFTLPDGSTLPANTTNAFGLSLDVSWEVDLWGRLSAGQRAAALRLAAGEAERDALAQSLAAQVGKIWFAIGEAEQQIALAASRAESFGAIAERIEARYRLGVRRSTDLRLARANAANAEANAAELAARLDGLVRQLEILLGGYPSGALRAGESGEIGLTLPPAPPAGLPAELIARRPDLAAAERRLAAAGEDRTVARRALYPRLSLTGSLGTTSTELDDLLDGDFSVWSIAAGLLQPIFQGGRLRAEIARTEGVRDEALAAFAGAALTAYAEVERALQRERLLAEELAATERAAEQLVAAERTTGRRYRDGVGSYLELLEAQTRAFEAESRTLTTRRELIENRIDLHLALGGGFPRSAS